MRNKIGNHLALLVLMVLLFTASLFFFGSSSLLWVLVIVAVFFLAVPFLPEVIRETNPKVWLYAGIFVLAGLVPPTHLLSGPLPGPPPVQTMLAVLILCMPSAAVVVGALLLYSGLSLYEARQNTTAQPGVEQPAQRRARDWTIALTFIVLALLMARTFYNLYWLMVWDSTGDSLSVLWLVFPMLAALFSAALLGHLLPDKYRGALWYGGLVPLLMIAVSAGATSISFRQRTEDRAARISQAIESYALREGRYPPSLGQLIPGYVLSLPGPVILYQQDWCYEAGENYYRLAYVDREHWSSPELFGQVYAAKGDLPPLPPACASEIQALFDRQPEYYGRNAAQ